jgi:hypothetical protein
MQGLGNTLGEPLQPRSIALFSELHQRIDENLVAFRFTRP